MHDMGMAVAVAAAPFSLHKILIQVPIWHFDCRICSPRQMISHHASHTAHTTHSSHSTHTAHTTTHRWILFRQFCDHALCCGEERGNSCCVYQRGSDNLEKIENIKSTFLTNFILFCERNISLGIFYSQQLEKDHYYHHYRIDTSYSYTHQSILRQSWRPPSITI